MLNKFNQNIDIPSKIDEYNKLPEIKKYRYRIQNFMKESDLKIKKKMLYLVNINTARIIVSIMVEILDIYIHFL